MAKASRTISHIEEQMSQNAIYDAWTQTWGIKVYPAYGIDKLKFSFIEKGASGKGKSFDIYVECLRDGAQCFDNWAYDIMHGRFEKILALEKQSGEKYPKTYKYTTGENAEKQIGIMNSTSGGYCINASVPGEDGKKNYCNIPVSFHDLRHIAERYMVSYEDRKKSLEEIRKKAAADYSKWNKDATDDTDEQTIDVPMENQSSEPIKEESKKANNKASEEKPTPDTTAIELKTNTTLNEDGKGNYILTAIDKDNHKGEFIFPKKYWNNNKYGKVGEQFKDKASQKAGIMVTLHFFVYNNKKYVAKIGK